MNKQEKRQLNKKEWKGIIVALKAMVETHNFMRGFGNTSEEEIFYNNLIKKIELDILKV